MLLLNKDRWLRHLIRRDEVIDNKIAPVAFDFRVGLCGALELSGKSCKHAKSDFHEKAIKKAEEINTSRKVNSFNYSWFLMVDFCDNCIIKENIMGTEYLFMCFYTPTKNDKTHCDLILANKNSISLRERVHLSRYSKTFKLMASTESIVCC